MERITYDPSPLSFCEMVMCREVRGGSFCEDGYCDQRRCWERLKQYEDTGLTPDSVTGTVNALTGKALAEIREFDGVSVARLRQLAEADKEGRLVVLKARREE